MSSAKAPAVAIDSSVLIARALPWHAHHFIAKELLAPWLASHAVCIPSRVLIECYSVLTRLPPAKRLSPGQVSLLLSKSLKRPNIRVCELPASHRWKRLEDWAKQGIAGGLVYDAEVAATAKHAGATRLLTLNVRHFLRVAPPGLEIVGPPSA